MQNFLITVAAGVTVGLIVNSMRKQPAPQAGTKASDYTGTAYQTWAATR